MSSTSCPTNVVDGEPDRKARREGGIADAVPRAARRRREDRETHGSRGCAQRRVGEVQRSSSAPSLIEDSSQWFARFR